MLKYWTEIFFILVNLAMAAWHAYLIRSNRPILHGLWTVGYFFLCALLIYVFRRDGLIGNWQWMAVASILVREVVFSPALNFFRAKPFFYTNPTGRGSELDRIEGRAVPFIYFISLAALITLQFFL